jgi:hypothetical protein
MAPIHFPSCPRSLPLPWGLHAHTHALSLLAGCTFPLPLLVILLLIILHLYYICLPDPWLVPLCPFHFTSTHPIISWALYLTIGPWCCHPIPLLHPQLVTQSPVTLTIVLVCDSTFPLSLPYYQALTCSLLLTFSCTTTYSLVCAHFPSLYKPYIPQLYSLTWIYLVLPGYLVPQPLKPNKLIRVIISITLTLGHHILDLQKPLSLSPTTQAIVIASCKTAPML